MKKLITLSLAAIMLFTLSAPAFAADLNEKFMGGELAEGKLPVISVDMAFSNTLYTGMIAEGVNTVLIEGIPVDVSNGGISYAQLNAIGTILVGLSAVSPEKVAEVAQGISVNADGSINFGNTTLPFPNKENDSSIQCSYNGVKYILHNNAIMYLNEQMLGITNSLGQYIPFVFAVDNTSSSNGSTTKQEVVSVKVVEKGVTASNIQGDLASAIGASSLTSTSVDDGAGSFTLTFDITQYVKNQSIETLQYWQSNPAELVGFTVGADVSVLVELSEVAVQSSSNSSAIQSSAVGFDALLYLYQNGEYVIAAENQLIFNSEYSLNLGSLLTKGSIINSDSSSLEGSGSNPNILIIEEKPISNSDSLRLDGLDEPILLEPLSGNKPSFLWFLENKG